MAPRKDPLIFVENAAAVNITPNEEILKRKRDLLARVRAMQDYSVNERGAVKGKNPDFVYCWVYNHPGMIAEYKSREYEIVEASFDACETHFVQKDGTHVRGDTILMRVSKDIHEALELARDLAATEASDGHKEQFEDWGQTYSVPVSKL